MINSTIKELNSDDQLQDCVGLLRSAFGTVASDYGLTEKAAPTNAAFTTLENLQRHVQQGMTLYGTYCDSSLVGCVAIKMSKGNELVFYIERLAVAPDRRHGGLGGQLLLFAIETIRRKGGSTASIGVMDNNDRLKKWYVSKGFVQRDCRRVAHLPFKVCFMSKDLKNH